MSQYKKEKRRIKILLGLGLVLDLVYIFGLMEGKEPGLSFLFSGQGILLLISGALYPLGVVYGWKSMFDVATSGPVYDKNLPFTFREQRDGAALTFGIFLLLILLFAWLLGPFIAYSRLRSIKKYETIKLRHRQF
jgi:hypothetical protein